MHAPMAIIATLIAMLGLSVPATAQTPSRQQDAAYEAGRLAFETLSETDRRAIQEALIWTGDYKGAVDGGYGRGTRTAMIAYARRVGLPDDGLFDTRARASLLAAANGAKAAVGFTLTADRVIVMSPRPGRIIASHQSLFERPRDPRSLRGDPRFGALVQTIWSELAVAD